MRALFADEGAELFSMPLFMPLFVPAAARTSCSVLVVPPAAAAPMVLHRHQAADPPL